MFHYDELQKFYNCSLKTPEQWHSYGRVNKGIGITYILIGVMYEVCRVDRSSLQFFQVLYFPCLYVMASQKFLKFSCYKIMYYLGLIDVACIVINSMASGWFSYQGYLGFQIRIYVFLGAVYCDYPAFMYISGSLSLGLWCSACMACKFNIHKFNNILRHALGIESTFRFAETTMDGNAIWRK